MQIPFLSWQHWSLENVEHSSSSLKVLQDVALLQPQLSSTLEGEDDGFVHQLHCSIVIEITPAKDKESWVRSLCLWPIHKVLELRQLCWNSSQLPHFAWTCLSHVEKDGKDVLKFHIHTFFEHFPGHLVPMLDNPFYKELFPNIQFKPPLKKIPVTATRHTTHEFWNAVPASPTVQRRK